MEFLRRIIANELDHYRKLNTESKTLLTSVFLFSIASPVLSIFISAFLWRVSQSVELILLYNIVIFIGAPLGFFINGFLLKKHNPTTFYFLGCAAQGVAAGSLLFLPALNMAIIAGFGFIYGVTSGIYWSNRVFLMIHHVKNHQRIYFTSLIHMASVVCSIVVPLVIGWYLVLGERTNTYSPTLAYQLLGVVVIGILVFAGWRIKKLTPVHTPNPYTTLRKPSRTWKKVRAMTYLMGLTNSMDIMLPALYILLFIGKEGKLGTIQAISGIFLAIALYFIAKKVGREHRFLVLISGISLSLLAGLTFGLWYSPIGVFVYFILTAFATPIRWTIVSPVTMDVIDGEARKYSKNRYAFIFDQELFLNIGRLTSLVLFGLLFLRMPEITTRFAPLLFALPQLFVIYIAYNLEKYHIHTPPELAPTYTIVPAVSEEEHPHK